MNTPFSTLSRRPFCQKPRRGFTLIELLTVIAIIGVLAAILFPMVSTVMIRARATTSASNLRSIGSGMALYATNNKGYLPAPLQGGAGILSNPKGSNWLVEMVEPLAGAMDLNAGSSKVVSWPKVLSDPEFMARNNNMVDNDAERGYGMNPFLYRPNGLNTNTVSQRQKKDNLPDPANNFLVGCSNTTTAEADATGQFKDAAKGDPTRYNGQASYLFVDGSVRTMSPDEAATSLAVRSGIKAGR